jgi:arsenate reductase (thioredoxin)
MKPQCTWLLGGSEVAARLGVEECMNAVEQALEWISQSIREIKEQNMKQFCLFLLVMASVLVITPYAQAQQEKVAKVKKPMKQSTVVVFVCEHGSAKSVVAAAHFNKIAREKKLKLRAVSRGTHPDKELPAGTIKGLQADGLKIDGEKPRKLSAADVAGALQVVAFCPLPEAYAKTTPVAHWDDVPPMSQDYNRFRDLVIERIRRLLEELGKAQ